MKNRKYTTSLALALALALAPAGAHAAKTSPKTKQKPKTQQRNNATTQPKRNIEKPSAMSAEQLLDKIFDTFHKQKIRSMVYDEIRTVSTSSSLPGPDEGLMDLDKNNASTYVMRVYYRAPDKHGYRMVSQPIKGFWPGSPNQEDALNMDERWPSRVRELFILTVADKPAEVRGAKCYLLSLTPRPGVKLAFPMTWYVDAKTFSIIKFMTLVKHPNGQRVSTTGEIFYGKVRGHTVPVRATWRTTASTTPIRFDYRVRYEKYMFNVPLQDGVFKQQPVPEPANN